MVSPELDVLLSWKNLSQQYLYLHLKSLRYTSNFSFYQLKTVPLWSEGGPPCHSYRNPALPGEYIRPLFLLRHEEYDLFKFDGYIPYLNIKQVSEFSETEMRSCVCKTGRSDRLSLASEIAPPWTDKKSAG